MNDLLITAVDIEIAANFGACAEALTWLRAAPRTVAELVSSHRGWGEWMAASVPLSAALAAALAAAGCGRSYWRLVPPSRMLARPSIHWELHREDGPAVERANGDREWWWYGQRERGEV